MIEISPISTTTPSVKRIKKVIRDGQKTPEKKAEQHEDDDKDDSDPQIQHIDETV